MPTSLTEWNELVDYMTAKAKAEYDAAVAQAKAQAEASHASLTGDKPSLADYISQAVASIARPQTRQDFEAMYACYYPQPEPEQPTPTFAELKAQKKADLDAAFHTACQHPVVMTADGWPADANETANRNVQGLITTMEATGAASVQFCDAENQFHDVTLDELKAIQLQIIELGQALYAKKWELRTAIEAAQDEDALAAIAISF